MIYKGCVVKIEKDFAIVVTNTMEYLKVIKKDGLVIGKQIIFVKEDIYREKQISLKHIGLIAAVFVMMIISVVSFGGLGDVSSAAAAVVSIDINPSIEFEINQAKQVIKVLPMNQEAEELMDQDLVGMPIEEALLAVVVKAKEKNYITKEKNSVLISTVVMKDDFQIDQGQLEKEIEVQLKQDEGIESINLIYVEATKQDFKAAKKQKISIGKYEVYKQEKEKNPQITIEQVQKMKVQEIVDQGIGTLKTKQIQNKKEQKKEERIKEKKEKKEQFYNQGQSQSVKPQQLPKEKMYQNDSNERKESQHEKNKKKEKISRTEEVEKRETVPLSTLQKKETQTKDQIKKHKEKTQKENKEKQKVYKKNNEEKQKTEEKKK